MFLFTDPKEVSDDAAFLLFPMAATLCIRFCLHRRCTHTHGSPRRLWWWLKFGEYHHKRPSKLDLLVLDSGWTSRLRSSIRLILIFILR